MESHSLPLSALFYLAAAVIIVPVTKRLGLGSVLGYLFAGILIGPAGLGLITHVENISHFAELGVALLLFIIGLELKPARLWGMRRPIIKLGIPQVALSALILFGIFWGMGTDFKAALVIAMGLSLSSTAIALQILRERNLFNIPAGHSAFSVLLLQDIAVIPMLVLIPWLGGSGLEADDILTGVAKFVLALMTILVLGHYLSDYAFRYIAKTRLPEIFTAFVLFLVSSVILLMEALHMSVALGCFIVGILFAESDYRHVLEAEIQPFKGLLMGLFFAAVGMRVNFNLPLQYPGLVLALSGGLLFIKYLILRSLAATCSTEPRQSVLFSIILCQGGEFAFVLFGAALNAHIFNEPLYELLIVVIVLSMAATPFLFLLNEKINLWLYPRRKDTASDKTADTIEEQKNPVIIAGFGRFGRIVARLLLANRVPTTILDHDPEHIENIRRYGYKVHYGDAARLDVLRAAGAEEAALLVLTVDDVDTSLHVVDQVQKHFPNLPIVARAYDMKHVMELLDRGVKVYQREMLESALTMGEEVLQQLGWGAYHAKQAAHRLRRHDKQLLRALYEEKTPEKRYSISYQAREELQRVLAADEEKLKEEHGRTQRR